MNEAFVEKDLLNNDALNKSPLRFFTKLSIDCLMVSPTFPSSARVLHAFIRCRYRELQWLCIDQLT